MTRMGWLPKIMLLMAGLAIGDHAALAQGGQVPVAADTALRGHVVLRGKRIPLPPGDWVRLSRGWGQVDGSGVGPYGAIEAVMLAQVNGNRIDAVALLAANVLPVETGWGAPAACEAAPFTTGVRLSARNLACAFAEDVRPDAPALGVLPAWRQGMAEAARRGLTMPDSLAVAGARVADRRDVVEARYGFDPARFAMRTAADRIVPEDELARWTRAMEVRLETALVDPSAAVAPLPAPGVVIGTTASGEMPAWQLGLYKLATNRIMQTAISFGIGMVLTADAYASTSLALWQSVTHSAVYYGNELAWEWPRTALRMDFVAEASQ